MQDRSPYAPTRNNKLGGQKDSQLDGLIQSLLQESDLQKAIAHNIEKYLGTQLFTIAFSHKARGLALIWPQVGDFSLYHPWPVSIAAVDYYPNWWYDASKKKC